MKRIGCLVPLVALVVIAFAYNQWVISQLRDEVGRISGKVHGVAGKKTTGGGDLVTALANAQRHTQRAKELMRKKRTAEAQQELDLALKSIDSASNVSQDIVGDAAQFLGKARDNTISTFRKAWKDISEQSQPKKKGS